MKFPTVNLNGTSKRALLEQQANALVAVNDAIDVLHEAYPNGRDYTPQGSPEALADLHQAISEHSDRILRLSNIAAELEQIALHISESAR